MFHYVMQVTVLYDVAPCSLVYMCVCVYIYIFICVCVCVCVCVCQTLILYLQKAGSSLLPIYQSAQSPW